MDNSLDSLRRASALNGANAEYIDQLYEAFKESPSNVSAQWRNYFFGFEQGVQGGGQGVASSAPSTREHPDSVHSRLQRLVLAYRLLGHLAADIDPLGLMEQNRPAELGPAYYGLGETDLDETLTLVSLDSEHELSAREVFAIFERVYCGSIACEHMHISSSDTRRWIEQRLESTRGDWAAQHTTDERREILGDLTAAEGLERYLHRRYVGQKRFSLEGGDSLMPLLDEIVQGGGKRGVSDIVISMAHRGRLNVLVNLLGKAPRDLFSEFEGGVQETNSHGSGDVKYHQGFYSDIQTPGGPVRLSLAFNPSHLEIAGPVVQGGCRARQDRYEGDAAARVLPVVIHGDAAFAGQGVVMETLNLSRTPAYSTGGTVHVVVNNQIGFTTHDTREARSTRYCTDVAKLVEAPIFHVNADDPDAVRFIARLALEFRMTFRQDVVVDLVCYRRHGHNEADDPMMTQPGMYQRIQQLPTTRELYLRRLLEEEAITPGQADAMVEHYQGSLDAGKAVVREFLHGSRTGYTENWETYLNARPGEPVDTRCDRETLRSLGERLLRLPQGFTPHRRIQRILDDRRRMLAGELPLDWGTAESLAYASLLREGYGIRLSGQDSQRGTFAHRHAVLHDQSTHASHTPLEHLYDGQPRFEVINSVLSELAVLAFEYGYATSRPNTLVIWEAQFGDFANCAQVVIDQFIASGYLKWDRLCQLTLFLPHGYEGQGPEHSSARLERFLQLSAELNMRVWVPTTPAQLFHVLRDQMKRAFRRPLVVMTPKSLLRHPLSKSSLDELAAGGFVSVLRETDPINPNQVRRVVLCSGKVYYDLLAERRRRGMEQVAILRVEQLYPFPRRLARERLAEYPLADEIVWCQEEPRNQGAWYQIKHHLSVVMQPGLRLGYAGRPPSASTACGHASLHQQQQQALVDTALSDAPADDPGERLDDSDHHYLG